MKEYSAEKGLFKVNINDNIENQLFRYSKKAYDKETGGILIGHYNDRLDTAIIKDITDAPSDSKAGNNWFIRGILGLKDLLWGLWEKDQYYLGEWHYHPFASPISSSTDDHQMKKISASQNMRCPELILLIVGGNPNDQLNYNIYVYTEESKYILSKIEK